MVPPLPRLDEARRHRRIWNLHGIKADGDACRQGSSGCSRTRLRPLQALHVSLPEAYHRFVQGGRLAPEAQAQERRQSED
jgi:hypothetical protein